MRGLALFLILVSAAACRAETRLSSTSEWDTESATVQSTPGPVQDSTDHALGPEDMNTEHCSAEGCEEVQGFSSDGTTEDGTDDDHDLQSAEEQNDSVQNWNVFSTIANTFTTVTDTLQHTAYKRTAQFGENVRSAVREEFWALLEDMWERSMGALFSDPDTLLGKFSQAVANKIMTIGLIIICLLLDYVFWQLYFSILFILAFDGTIFLMYKIWGPAWVYSTFWYMINHVWYLLSFVWTHPYISSFVIVIFFILGSISPIVRYLTHRKRVKQVNNIEQTVLLLSERLSKMEERQADILQRAIPTDERLSRMEERQEQILQLLRDMKAATIHARDT